MKRTRVLRAAIAGVVAAQVVAALAGCSPAAPSPSNHPTAAATEQVAPGDIPDTQAYVTVKAPSGGWSLKVPEGWAQQTVPGGLMFTDKLNAVGAVERSAAQAPTVASVQTGEVAALRAAHAGVQVVSVAPFTRSGGSGVVVRYTLDSAKDAVTGKVHRDAAEEYLFAKNGREVAVTVSGAVGADNVDPWKIITDSFRWLR
ncbi:MAG TPA: hypothetical protein VGO26_02320 [Amnibacterium sp.]|nr:hypothetical protein [Amnibacterium sp.]